MSVFSNVYLMQELIILSIITIDIVRNRVRWIFLSIQLFKSSKTKQGSVMTKLVKLAVATAVVFGASSAMAVNACTENGPGVLLEEGKTEYTLGDACCLYVKGEDGVLVPFQDGIHLVEGIIKDAYKKDIYPLDAQVGDAPIAREKTIKCALAKKPKATGPREKGEQYTARIADDYEMCLAPKRIKPEVEEVEADSTTTPPTDAVAYKPAELKRIRETNNWQNVISASGEVSLVCTHTKNLTD